MSNIDRRGFMTRLNSDKPLTADTWHEYYKGEYEDDFPRLLGNMDANEQIGLALKEIVETTPRKKLKEKLLLFIQQRFELVEDFDDKWIEQPEKFNLPRIGIP
ncbi:hypothetical protein A3860_33765 [Niastella vici]|uniref:Uncharacterized protein n=1 Tax=Niastella vici TaxID=1703345 RepID=A0A1V9FPQ7_9BACT|nr:hypothetical protein [Niastella vici]OQP60349.1 hypothetical protein A3860_33765 [Niastella vici]